MNKTLTDYRLIEKWSSRMDGVFSRGDLANLFDEKKSLLLNRRIASLIKNRALTRVLRGFYCTEACNLEILSQRIWPDSYLSLGTVLARRVLIGSIPVKTVYAVKTGRNRSYNFTFGSLVYCGIAQNLFTGFEYENGIRYATAEKAFLDTLYFYQKGFRFSFNLFHDIAISSLDKKNIEGLLKRYKNPKYIAFVKGILSGGHS